MRLGTSGFNGDKLREAREARGLNGISLAFLLQVSRQAVSQYETGKTTPSPEVLDLLCNKLDLQEWFFVQPDDDYGIGTIYFRSFGSATKIARQRVRVRLKWRTKILAYLHQLLEFRRATLPDVPIEGNPLALPPHRIEEIAGLCRQTWGIGDGAISDVSLLLENKGFILSTEEVGSQKLDACSAWSYQFDTPLIVGSTDKRSAVRSRFNLCHEVGHLILHNNVDERTFADNLKEFERQADQFASAFLLPRTTFLNDFMHPSLDVFKLLKKRWKVSISAMVRRCHTLGVIDEEDYTRMNKQISSRWGRKWEPLDDEIKPEHPRMLRQCIERIVEAGVQSKNDVKAAVPYSPTDIEELTNLPRGYLSGEHAKIIQLPTIRENSASGGANP